MAGCGSAFTMDGQPCCWCCGHVDCKDCLDHDILECGCTSCAYIADCYKHGVIR